MSSEEETVANRYVEAAGSVDDGRYAIRAEELTWLLDVTLRFNSLRLKLLTSLQRALLHVVQSVIASVRVFPLRGRTIRIPETFGQT